MRKIRDTFDKLKDTDLVGTIRQFERNEASGAYLYKVTKTTAEIYGSEYVIKLGREMVSNPQHPRFNLRANSVMLVRYWMLYMGKMYQATRKKEFLDFIAGYLTHSDVRIRKEAKERLQKIGAEELVDTKDNQD